MSFIDLLCLDLAAFWGGGGGGGGQSTDLCECF